MGGVVGSINDGIIFGKRIPGSSCAERDLDGDSSNTCCHHQKRITQPPIKFDDEFEEYRARANSGGSLFGLLRRQQNICEEDPPPYKGRPKRQRSKSLVPNPDSTLKLFPGGRRRPTSPCQCMDNTYLISPKPPRHPRRFSAACVDARDVISKHNITVSISPPPSSPHSTDSSWIGEIEEELSQIEELPDSLPNSSPRPSPHVTPRSSPRVSPRGSPAGGSPVHRTSLEDAQACARDLLKPPGMFPLPMGKTVDDLRQTVYRRRSFCITSKGIINEGDFFVDKLAKTVIDASSIGSDLDLELGMDRSRASSFNSQGSALWSGASSDTQCHRVLVLGAAGVGKTSLTQQFCTSEYMGAQNTSFGKFGSNYQNVW